MTLLPAAHEPFTAPTILEVSEIATAVVRFRGITMASLSSVYDRAFGALRQAIAEGAITPNGAPFGRYLGDPQGEFDLEVGFPVEGMPTTYTAGDLTVTTGSIPAARTAVLSAVGPFDRLPSAWTALADFAASQGQSRGDWTEVYVSDPSSTSAEQLRTDLMMPLRS
ncbi:GyrI-like domain-containing protein [Microbacterium sp. ZW T5_56]|uniref:GyrI-like domain-containing protein n=1 Tax=Microbacterium sp. ZW T5_56 TaxID=3378081 RepID=UPI0038537A61